MTAPDRDIDIVVVGEINPDIIVADPDPVPIFDEVERVVDSIRMTVGSSSAIFACGAARLGLRIAFCGVVGDDALGRFMLDAMAEHGIDVSACVVDPHRPTGATVIMTSGSQRAMLTAMGAIGALDVDAVPSSLIARARHLHLGAFYLQDRSRERLPAFFAAARVRGLTTSFDTNWDPDRTMGRRRPRDAPGIGRLLPERRRGPPDRTDRRCRRGRRWHWRRWEPRDGPMAGRSWRSSWVRPAPSR